MLSILQNNLHNHKDAIENLKKAIELEPNNAENYSNISMCYSCLGEINKAIAYSQKAIELDRNAIFLNNLGLQYKKNNQPDKAIECFNESLEKSYDPYVVVNLGSTWSDKLDVDRARSTILEITEKHPGISGAHVNLSWCYLVNKEYEKGWIEYEHRLRHFPQCLAYLDKFGEQQMWDGEASLEGKRILVFCEQGLGDAIQFIRYVKFLKAEKVIVCCSIALADLFKNVEGVDEICYKDLPDKYPEYDYHISIVSLPHRLKKPTPWQEVYIKSSKNFTLPDKFNDKLKIGLCWRGNPDHHNDSNRSMDLVHFYDITKNDAYFFSLQKDAKVNPSVMKTMNIEYEYIRECHDLNETAALIDNLDLVVTVDTGILHLASAMGKETIGLIPFKPDWRWGLNDSESVWYPDNLKLIRQNKLGDWSNVIEQLKEIISEKVNK
jgi:ADP-heptose:LPS heptosyltransferase